MKQIISLCSILLLITSSTFVFAEENEEIEETISYNPRDEYPLGIGPLLGGISGGVGLEVDYNVSPKVGLQTGVGSGYYFESIFLTSRYYLLLTKLSPFASLGYSLWRANSGIEQLNDIKGIKNLNLTKGDFAHLVPLSVGLHYMSESGLAAFVSFDYILSPGTTSGIPYGSAGFVWYF